MTRVQSRQASRIPLPLSLPLAVVAGLAMSAQGRVNGALGARLGDGLAAAVISFGIGLVLMAALTVLPPAGRRALKRVRPALRERKFPLWYLLAGASGAFLVMSQGVTVAVTGIALFTVAVVSGQSVSGLLVDRIGLGPGGRRYLTGLRILSALLTVAAVVWAVSPKFSTGGPTAAWLLPLALPLLAGFLQSFQQALNGTQTMHYGSPAPATLINFIVGFLLLCLAWLVKLAVAGGAEPLPAQWWYYLGGPLGCFFILVGAVVVASLGVLLTGLGMIAGQLLGALLLDAFFPVPGSVIATATVLGTLLALAAMVLATLPWPRAAFPAALRRGRRTGR
ncbi:DMT family transporter [Arthrobacter sp. I2-34]|uniref:DMT family transporter n=1 Tax=Arthrobacter hankyongi TaxID=2904801 RepID=A0ABS9L1B0_9MICC|nr:DMT family transporter [Arthrobacter hankyongi]MCG2620431.1 DMT family transporter [Arthrobacter hankyongi]